MNTMMNNSYKSYSSLNNIIEQHYETLEIMHMCIYIYTDYIAVPSHFTLQKSPGLNLCLGHQDIASQLGLKGWGVGNAMR